MIPAVDHRADPTGSPLCRTEGAGAEGHLHGRLLYSRLGASCAGRSSALQHSHSLQGPGGSVCVPTRVRSVLGCSDMLSKCHPSGYSVLFEDCKPYNLSAFTLAFRIK